MVREAACAPAPRDGQSHDASDTDRGPPPPPRATRGDAHAGALAVTGARAALAALWAAADLPPDALDDVALPGDGPVLPSSFPVAIAAQASLAAAALAAAELGRPHAPAGARVRVEVDRRAAAIESTGWFSLDGVVPPQWDPLSGLYPCGSGAEPGWVRIHANFAHHRDAALRVLGLPPGDGSPREAVAQALRGWRAQAFEDAVAQAGGVAAAARTFEEWDAHLQGLAVAALEPVAIERIGDAPPLRRPAPGAAHRPLEGLRVLDLTRILAGPIGGRTLAAYGADVMRVGSPALPEIASIADTGRGKRSAHVDLATATGRATLRALASDAHVFQQGYRPGALEALGFGPAALAAMRPGIVCVSLSAWGEVGPWAGRRGFDSLVQTATGFNLAEARAAGETVPRALPMQILDCASGFLMAFGALAALRRQATEGGSWAVRVSLAATAHWLRGLGRVEGGLAVERSAFEDLKESMDSGFGRLVAVRHAARLDGVPVAWARASVPPGTDPPSWDAVR
jgi:hypothetical protein